MALLLFDGFDGYDSLADVVDMGLWASCVPSASLISTVRYGTGKCLKMSYNFFFLQYVFPADQAAKTLHVGFSLMQENPLINAPIFLLSNAVNSLQLRLYVNASQKLEARGAGAAIWATGTTTLKVGVYYYIELKLLVANSSGIFDCRINGLSEFTFSGDTQVAATNEVKQLWFGNESNSNCSWRLDDVYVLDTTGTLNNTYLGEQRAELIYPTSDSTVAFSHNTGASNWDAINDVVGAADDDTTYVLGTTGQKDEYGLANLASVNTVAGVKVMTRASRDDINAVNLKTGIKSGTTNQQVTHAVTVGYTNFVDIFETSDGAGTAFTTTTIDSLLSTLEVP